MMHSVGRDVQICAVLSFSPESLARSIPGGINRVCVEVGVGESIQRDVIFEELVVPDGYPLFALVEPQQYPV